MLVLCITAAFLFGSAYGQQPNCTDYDVATQRAELTGCGIFVQVDYDGDGDFSLENALDWFFETCTDAGCTDEDFYEALGDIPLCDGEREIVFAGFASSGFPEGVPELIEEVDVVAWYALILSVSGASDPMSFDDFMLWWGPYFVDDVEQCPECEFCAATFRKTIW